jgi:hypothetical protein
VTDKKMICYVFGDFRARKLGVEFIVLAGFNESGSAMITIFTYNSFYQKMIHSSLIQKDKQFLYDYIKYILFSHTNRKYIGITKKEIVAHICGISKRAASFITGKFVTLFRCYYGLNTKDFNRLKSINVRLYGSNLFSVYNNLQERFTQEEIELFLSDMRKLNTGLCIYILDRADKIRTFEDYLTLVKKAPRFIKNCSYCLHFNDKQISFIKRYNFNPKTRFQYYMVNALTSKEALYSDVITKNLLKFKHADIKVWHIFMDYERYRHRYYSVEGLGHMLQTIVDGYSIYNNNCMNQYGITFDEIKGSPVKQLQKAIFNHNQEEKVRRKKLLDEPNEPLYDPPIKLPDWIEDIRIKTRHDILNAGIECDHCIGSLSRSRDIFVREGDVCAQISRNTLKVIQCYDVGDEITEKSKDLASRLNTSLEELRYNRDKLGVDT